MQTHGLIVAFCIIVFLLKIQFPKNIPIIIRILNCCIAHSRLQYINGVCVAGMWATRQMTKGEDREIYVRTTLRELVIYIIFLIILCVCKLFHCSLLTVPFVLPSRRYLQLTSSTS